MNSAENIPNLYSISESMHVRFAKVFFTGMTEFFADPKNEAEFQEWRRKRREGLGDVKT